MFTVSQSSDLYFGKLKSVTFFSAYLHMHFVGWGGVGECLFKQIYVSSVGVGSHGSHQES